MADPDPMDGGPPLVHLSLHEVQVDYLRGSLGNFLSGLDDDITGHPDDPDVKTWKAERDVYRRLDEGLARGQVVAADKETRRLVRRWAASNDRSEEFGRILFEHQTLASLREQIEAEL